MSVPSIKNELLDLVADADLLQKIHLHVSCGGSLIGFAKLKDVPYTYLRRWLKNDKDREKVYQTALAERDEWCRERVLEELRIISTLDPSAIYDENGAVIAPENWSEELRRNIYAIEVKEEFEMEDGHRVFTGYTKRIKFHDKLKAIEMIGKNLKLWTSDKTNDQSMKLEDILALAIKLERGNTG